MPAIQTKSETSGWMICRSICAELDLAIHFLFSQEIALLSIPALQNLIQSIPSEWIDELRDLAVFTAKNQSILEILASLANVSLEEDYGRATLAIREMDLPAVLLAIPAVAGESEAPFQAGLPTLEQTADLVADWNKSAFQRMGVHAQPEFFSQNRNEILQGLGILSGQPLHNRFWHWMDRFYYECYRPWRTGQLPVMEKQETQALAALGAPAASGQIPSLDWLPSINSIHQISEVRSAIQEGKLKACFWVEPFGIAESWTLLPERGSVLVSFAEPGEIYTHFFTRAEKLALQTQALADPHRLIMLRLIRYFGMTNTDMARFLNLSRPTVSIHARILREAGLIVSTSAGRTTHHEIQSEELRQLFHDLEQFLDLPES